MVKKLINFELPDPEFGYEYVQVERGLFSTGPWVILTASDDPHWVTGKGVLLSAYDYVVDNNGDDTCYYRLRFFDSTHSVYSDYAVATTTSYKAYCSVQDIRDFTNIQSGEYSDDALQQRIDQATVLIDIQTGRTWQGIQTITNLQLDGDNTSSIILPHGDIVAVTDLSYWDGGAYSTIASTNYTVLPIEGIIYLNIDGNAIVQNMFSSQERKNIQVSYTWGKTAPDDSVKMLCILEVANMLKRDPTKTAQIEELKNFIGRKGITSLS